MENNIMVFGLTANLDLVGEVCAKLGIQPGKLSVKHFADGEIIVFSLMRGSRIVGRIDLSA